MINEYLNILRRDYSGKELDVSNTPENPFSLFDQWFEEAVHAQVLEPNAMHISTISSEGKPDGRIVLLKEITPRGFVFYTNYLSKKGKDLTSHPDVNITFFWIEIMRQVRIKGVAQKTSPEKSDQYFQSRPIDAQCSSAISPQSAVVEDLSSFKQSYQRLLDLKQPVARPDHWGGFEIVAEEFEFWQGQAGRFHDRITYQKHENQWIKKRLAP